MTSNEGQNSILRGNQIQPGQLCSIRDAFDVWRAATTDSVVEGTHHGGGRKVHDFTVIWVIPEGSNERIPWPIEDVEVYG